MQEVWKGKGDHKLIYKITDDKAPLRDLPYTILKRYGSICDEEKYSVLPFNVRVHIANTVKAWVEKSPVERTSIGETLTGSLTLMAHGTHQIYLSFDRFLNCKFDDVKILKILRCYKNCVPEPGTYFGEIVAQFFQHCKQQTNLNVKRSVSSSGNEDKIKQKQDKKNQQLEQNIEIIDRLITASTQSETMMRSAGDDYNCGSRRRERPTADMDRKFEVIMSLKKAVTVELMFFCKQKSSFGRTSDNKSFEHYLKNRVFGILVKSDGKHLLSDTEHEFGIKQFENKPNTDIYFSLKVYRKNKHDVTLDQLFECVDIFNTSIRNGIKHRLDVFTLVYCSDTLYFMEVSKRHFIDNSVTFLYCFLTEKYRPVIETKQDSFIFGLVKILSSIEYFTKCSLKRNHNGKMGYGPLTSVISEGGLNESTKYVNNLFRDSFLMNKSSTTTQPPPPSPSVSYEPCSPSYDPESEQGPPSIKDLPNYSSANESINNTRNYVINEPYINTFLNRPVECGSMY